MDRRLISTGSPMEAEAAYSCAVVQGDWCFVAGVIGYGYATMQMPRGITIQTRSCYATVRRVLQEAGFGFDTIVRVTHCVADRDLVEALLPLLSEELGEVRPAATMVIAGLMKFEMFDEAEVTAFRGA